MFWMKNKKVNFLVRTPNLRPVVIPYYKSNCQIAYRKKNVGPHSVVDKVSNYRCLSDCRSRGCEFDPGPVVYFSGD